MKTQILDCFLYLPKFRPQAKIEKSTQKLKTPWSLKNTFVYTILDLRVSKRNKQSLFRDLLNDQKGTLATWGSYKNYLDQCRFFTQNLGISLDFTGKKVEPHRSRVASVILLALGQNLQTSQESGKRERKQSRFCPEVSKTHKIFD